MRQLIGSSWLQRDDTRGALQRVKNRGIRVQVTVDIGSGKRDDNRPIRMGAGESLNRGCAFSSVKGNEHVAGGVRLKRSQAYIVTQPAKHARPAIGRYSVARPKIGLGRRHQ